MERTVIPYHTLLFKAAIIIVVAAIIISVIVVILIGPDFTGPSGFRRSWPVLIIGTAVVILIIVSRIEGFEGNKEHIIIDDLGLTLNGSIMLGPIPWDCVSSAKVSKAAKEKQLAVKITNISKLESIFGEEAVRKKVGNDPKTGERLILMDLGHFSLYDPEKLINERAEGRAD